MSIEAAHFVINRRVNCNLIGNGYTYVDPGFVANFDYMEPAKIKAVLDDTEEFANFHITDADEDTLVRKRAVDGEVVWQRVSTAVPIVLNRNELLQIKGWNRAIEFVIDPSKTPENLVQ